MLIKSRFLALTAAFSLLLISSVNAGVLNGIAGAFNDGNGPAAGAWTGSTTYDNGLAFPNNLFGTIDYAVMTASDFLAAFPLAGQGADPVTTLPYAPGNALVYLYQVNNQGIFSVSAEIVGINNPADTIGQFENASGEIAADARVFGTGGNANYIFGDPLIGTGQSSFILAYSSPNAPEIGAAITVNGGTIGLSMVPVPGATAIPEPASLALAALGALALVVRRRR